MPHRKMQSPLTFRVALLILISSRCKARLEDASKLSLSQEIYIRPWFTIRRPALNVAIKGFVFNDLDRIFSPLHRKKASTLASTFLGVLGRDGSNTPARPTTLNIRPRNFLCRICLLRSGRSHDRHHCL